MKSKYKHNFAIIHRYCKHIKYKEVLPLPERGLYLLADKEKKAVALVEVENNQVKITQ